MTQKYTLSLMFDRDEVLRSYVLGDNHAVESKSSSEIDALPSYIYERLALLKLTDNLTTVEHIGRRVGLGYYVIYINTQEYNEVNKIIKQRKSANEKETSNPSSNP